MLSFFSLREKSFNLSRRAGNLPIRVRLFLITFGIILFFLGIIFITNTLLLQPYYNYMKEKKLISTLQKISELDYSDTDDSGKASYNLSTELKSIEESDNIHIIILDEHLNFFYIELICFHFASSIVPIVLLTCSYY